VKPLLVGELNPYGADPKHALFPYPERSAGGRLCHRILAMHRAEYLRSFDRVNLCVGKWSVPAARRRAFELRQLRQPTILLGVKVCNAFLVHFRPFEVSGGCLVLPHPSGLCRLWNEPGAYERARTAVAAFLANTEKPLTVGEG
jgi:hypothetical protein